MRRIADSDEVRRLVRKGAAAFNAKAGVAGPVLTLRKPMGSRIRRHHL